MTLSSVFLQIKNDFLIPPVNGDKNYTIIGDESGFQQNLTNSSLRNQTLVNSPKNTTALQSNPVKKSENEKDLWRNK